jgi:hypothetical protein
MGGLHLTVTQPRHAWILSATEDAKAMSRRTLNLIVVCVIASLVAYVVLGIALVLGEAKDRWFDLYKALVSLVIAVPAAVLAAAFQRRTSYLGSLRDLWKQLIPAAQEAIQYTYLEEPEQEQFARVQTMLSTAIDSLRGVFKNVHRPGVPAGLYPFENLKDIQQIVSWLGFGPKFKRDQRAVARKCITLLWQEMHADLLPEFDREEPTKPAGKFLHAGRSIADDLITGTLTDDCLQACSRRQRLPSQGCGDGKPGKPAEPGSVLSRGDS